MSELKTFVVTTIFRDEIQAETEEQAREKHLELLTEWSENNDFYGNCIQDIEER